MDGTDVLVIEERTRTVADEVGLAPEVHARVVRRVDRRGCLAAPGLVDCHHLDQRTTHGLAGKKEVAL